MRPILPRNTRRRLSALRGDGPLPAPGEPAKAPEEAEPAAPGPEPLVVRAPNELPPGRELVGEDGPCLSYRLAPSEGHARLEARLQQAAAELAGSPLAVEQGHQAAYLDLETLGLAGSPLFLVGLLHSGGDGYHLHQFLAADYGQEGAVLQACAPLVAQAECLVSYNGRSFDWPLLTERLRYWGLPALPAPARHLDLLLVARRLLRRRVPDCTLGTVETHVLGLRRVEDVPGAQIPPLYHQAVATADLRLLAPVLHHNLVDLVALACLAGAWREAWSAPTTD